MKHPLETRCGHGAPVGGSKRARIEGHVVYGQGRSLDSPKCQVGECEVHGGIDEQIRSSASLSPNATFSRLVVLG